jgi:hypothetical protein
MQEQLISLARERGKFIDYEEFFGMRERFK